MLYLPKLLSLGSSVLVTCTLMSCSALNIGHNKFYCQLDDVKCVNASTYLSQNPKSNSAIQVTRFNDLIPQQVYPSPSILLQNEAHTDHLLIWIAPNRIGTKVYQARYLIVPYIH